jgi:hypothetical protein
VARSVLQPHKDEMQARSDTSTAPHFVRGEKVTVATKKSFRARTTEPEATQSTAWTFYNRGVDWKAQLHIKAADDNSLTPIVTH